MSLRISGVDWVLYNQRRPRDLTNLIIVYRTKKSVQYWVDINVRYHDFFADPEIVVWTLLFSISSVSRSY